ncbi:MAG: preprotein translocase subunit SecG [Paracoccus sp. (in: a-proteobacteria)]|uniref:preprotein translocase subunit SecG n=1 Tax=Paracoccus sp. TaxID=267 RepID=UPI0039E666FD
MENIVLTVHLILAVLLIGVVLLQRSEGGGLGMGGGGGGVMTGRQAANALSRATWILAAAFLITSLALTIIAARNASSGSIVDQLNLGGDAGEEPATTLPGIGEYTPPPSAVGQPILPPVQGTATETPAAPAQIAPVESAPVTPPATTEPAETTAPEAQPEAATASESPAPASPAPAN